MCNINNTQIDNAKNVVMSLYNLIEHSDKNWKTSASLWKYCRGDSSDLILNSKSFLPKIEKTGKAPADDNKKDSTIAVKSSSTIKILE